MIAESLTKSAVALLDDPTTSLGQVDQLCVDLPDNGKAFRRLFAYTRQGGQWTEGDVVRAVSSES